MKFLTPEEHMCTIIKAIALFKKTCNVVLCQFEEILFNSEFKVEDLSQG